MDYKLLKKLMDIHAVSGSEEKIRAFIKKEIRPYVNSVKIDRAGNLIAHQKGPKPTVMFASHMDEIGLMVKSIDTNGRIHFEKIGGIDNVTLIGQRVLIETKIKSVNGVITTKLLSEGDDIEELPKDKNLIIDTGLSKKELKKKGVRIGSFISLIQETQKLGDKKIICGKAVDDRIGCYMLIQLAKLCHKVKKNEVYFVFTVQEEMGLYGAKTSAYHVNPDWAIAIDVTDATDTDSENATQILGKGPTITAKDSDMIGNKCINGWLEAISKKNKIPIQWDVSDKGTTDAISIYFSRGGVPATVVGVPVRNMHSTIGIAHADDVDNAIKLLGLLLKKPPKTCII
tara:strand:+ start:7486 stop:8514 length:1029 start_codon:yes stop_codon:yes gene_type:complete